MGFVGKLKLIESSKPRREEEFIGLFDSLPIVGQKFEMELMDGEHFYQTTEVQDITHLDKTERLFSTKNSKYHLKINGIMNASMTKRRCPCCED